MLGKLNLKLKTGGVRKLAPLFMLSVTVALLILNLGTVRSPVLGVLVSIFYIGLNGVLLGNTFFQNEDCYLKWAFGVLSFVTLLVFVGTAVLLILRVSIVVTSALTVFFIGVFTAILSVGKAHRAQKKGVKIENEQRSKFSVEVSTLLQCVLYAAFIGYLLFALFNTRSYWIYGSIWDVLPPNFLLSYFLTSVVLLGLVLSQGKMVVKLTLIVIHSIFSLTLFVMVVGAAIPLYDPWVHLGMSVTLYTHGSTIWAPLASISNLYGFIYIRGLSVLVSILSELLGTNLLWNHVLLTPILWGTFVPLTAYMITKRVGGGNRSSLLSAFFSIFCLSLFGWATMSESNSLGYVFFFFSILLFVRYLSSNSIKTILLMFVTSVASVIAHPLNGTVVFSLLVLAIGLKTYRSMKMKNRYLAYAQLILLFIVATSIIPAMALFRGKVSAGYEARYGVTAFSVSQLFQTDLWHVIFGEFMDLSLKETMFYWFPSLLGVAGLAYTLKHKRKYNTLLSLFLLLAFIIIVVDYRILLYAMVNVPFTPRVLLSSRDFVIIPFVGIAVNSFIRQFPETLSKINARTNPKRRFKIGLKISKRDLAIAFVCIGFSSVAVAVAYDVYALRRGLQVTELEINAVKYIDEHTPERYVVITEARLWAVGVGNVGYQNPEKLYLYNRGTKYNLIGYDPSIDNMMWAMSQTGASVGYFVAVSFRTKNYESAVEKASRVFRPYAVLRENDLEISIFRYERPLPTTSDVSTFYWDRPPTYIIQNDLISVSIDLSDRKLEARDHWGSLYESIKFDDTLLNGEELGNLTSLEYFLPSANTWVEWDAQDVIPMSFVLTQQVRFKLRFERASLIGVVERGKPFVQLWWENSQNSTLSLDVGDFTRLYIPGLVEGEGSYNVISREYGLIYTVSRTENVTLHPAYRYEINSSSLTYDQIASYGGLNLTEGYVWYDIYVDNNADVEQWAHVETWLPDAVHLSSYPPLSYSVDNGKTWIQRLPYTREPIRTLSDAPVNWVLSKTRVTNEYPVPWSYSKMGSGGNPMLPENFTDSGGGYNRIVFSVYLPPRDEVLVRLGASIYYVRPLQLTYEFRNTADASYGLLNANDGLIATYNLGASEYVGGIALTRRPLSLYITQDEESKMKSMVLTIPSNTTFSLLSAKEANTAVDLNDDGVPDVISGGTGDTLALRARESRVKLLYEVEELSDRYLLKAEVGYWSDWEPTPLVTICVPSDSRYEGGSTLFHRGLSTVLEVEVTDSETETIMLYK